MPCQYVQRCCEADNNNTQNLRQKSKFITKWTCLNTSRTSHFHTSASNFGTYREPTTKHIFLSKQPSISQQMQCNHGKLVKKKTPENNQRVVTNMWPTFLQPPMVGYSQFFLYQKKRDPHTTNLTALCTYILIFHHNLSKENYDTFCWHLLRTMTDWRLAPQNIRQACVDESIILVRSANFKDNSFVS